MLKYIFYLPIAVYLIADGFVKKYLTEPGSLTMSMTFNRVNGMEMDFNVFANFFVYSA